MYIIQEIPSSVHFICLTLENYAASILLVSGNLEFHNSCQHANASNKKGISIPYKSGNMGKCWVMYIELVMRNLLKTLLWICFSLWYLNPIISIAMLASKKCWCKHRNINTFFGLKMYLGLIVPYTLPTGKVFQKSDLSHEGNWQDTSTGYISLSVTLYFHLYVNERL